MGKRPLWISKHIIIDTEDAATLKPGEKITLKNWGNFRLDNVSEAGLEGEFLYEDHDFKSTKKITWLAGDVDLAEVELIELDHLIDKEKVEDDKDIDKSVREVTKYVTKSLADPFLFTLKANDMLQI